MANRIVTGSVSHADDIMSALDEKAAQQAATAAQNNTEVIISLFISAARLRTLIREHSSCRNSRPLPFFSN